MLQSDAVAKRRERQREWCRQNREVKRARDRAWYARTKDDPKHIEARRQSRVRRGEKRAATIKKWREANPGYATRSFRKWKYGVTPEQYAAMLVAQHGVCAICENPPKPGKTLHVDHDHVTNRVRQLLCNSCNIRVGYIEHVLFAKSFAYIKRHTMNEQVKACLVVAGEG